MQNITQVLEKIDSWVWGPPLLILLVGTGIYLTIRLGLLQVFKLPLALKYVLPRTRKAKLPEMYQALQHYVPL